MPEEAIKINAQPEPDPTRCKFNINRIIYDGTFYCPNRSIAKDSPLLEALFEIPQITEILVSGNNLIIGIERTEPWQMIGKEIGNIIRKQIQTGTKLLADELPTTETEKEIPHPDLKTPIAQKIKKLIEDQINPAISSHGGWCALIDVKDNIAFIQLGGGCQGCGMVDVTLKQGIERTIKASFPSIEKVYDRTDHAAGKNPYYVP